MCDDGDDDIVLVSVGEVDWRVVFPCNEVVVASVVEVEVGIRTGDDER